MKLVIHGQQGFSSAVLEAIVARGVDEVVAVYVALEDTDSTISDPLETTAHRLGLDVYRPSSYKDPKLWQQIEDHNADLGVMAHITVFVPEEALNAPRLGTIKYHPSLLPDHRGRSAINWPIIMGKAETGVSVFWPDNGLDTGPVLLQKRCVIEPHDTAGTLYADRLHPMGIDALLDAIEAVREGRAAKEEQDPDDGSYEIRCRRAHAEIDWSRPAVDVYNLIRGCNPEPGAWTLFAGEELTFLECRLSDAVYDETPGTLVAISDTDFTVALNGGSLRVERVCRPGSESVAAGHWYMTSQNTGLNTFLGVERDAASKSLPA